MTALPISTLERSASGHAFDVPQSTIATTLEPYKENAIYLKTARIEVRPTAKGVILQAFGRFSIQESCYIRNTGHFNAVELIICYNQLGYVLINESLRRKIGDWTYAASLHDGNFAERQLRDVLIYELVKVRFARVINPRDFRGCITWHWARQKRGLVLAHTECKFWDDNGGDAGGELRVVLNNETIEGSKQ